MDGGFDRTLHVDSSSDNESLKGLELNQDFMVGKEDFWRENRTRGRMDFLKDNEIQFGILTSIIKVFIYYNEFYLKLFLSAIKILIYRKIHYKNQ